MGAVKVREFMSLDGVIHAPTWTFDYGFDPTMGQAIAAAIEGCRAILLGRTTYQEFEPAGSQRTAEDDPDANHHELAELRARRAVRPRHDPAPEERPRRRSLRPPAGVTRRVR